MVELYSSFFCMLRLAKRLYESGFADKLPDSFQTLTLDEDLYYNLSYEAADVIFEGTSFYYNENSGANVYVTRTPSRGQRKDIKFFRLAAHGCQLLLCRKA